MSNQLLNVFDDRMLEKIYNYAKNNKPTGVSIEDFITEDFRKEVMQLVVENIPISVKFTGNDLLTYMNYINNMVGMTNHYKRYIQTNLRR